MVAVSDFVAVIIGSIIGGFFAILAGVIAAAVAAKRTEEVTLELRRREREEEAMWELAFSLREILDTLQQKRPGAKGLLDQLQVRWRTHLAPAIRDVVIGQRLGQVQQLADDQLDFLSPDTKQLESAIRGLLDKMPAQTFAMGEGD